MFYICLLLYLAAQEGLCSCYVIAAIPVLDSSASLARNRSFSVKRGAVLSKELSKVNTGKNGKRNHVNTGRTGERNHMF